jgi:hypothetical protein
MTQTSGSNPVALHSRETCRTTPDVINSRLLPYIGMAVTALAEHSAHLNDDSRLVLIVEAALESRSLFFAATLWEPAQRELNQFFEDFVLRCVLHPDSREER